MIQSNNYLLKSAAKVEDLFSARGEIGISVYDDKVVNFLNAISQALFSSPKYSRDAALVSLAFWLRKSNILSLRKLIGPSSRRRRGLVFHICPSNVDTMFVYSWAVSLLMGNKNIVRVSSRTSERLESLLSVIDQILSLNDFQEIAISNTILTYGHSKEVTDYLSLRCDLRIIWGGDSSIGLIRQSPLKSSATDVVFADRSSCSIFNEEAVRNATLGQMQSLYKAFFNDTYTYLQKACSSPRILFWVGDSNRIHESQERFWSEFQAYVRSCGVDIPMSLVSEKISSMQKMIMKSEESIGINNYQDMHATSVIVSSMKSIESEGFVGGGFFFNRYLSNFSEIFNDLDDKFQTCTYFGFESNDLKRLVEEQPCLSSVDRWVPVGKALDFSPIWDGYNLFHECSKEVSFR